MIFFPNCKINLGLHITAKREDGFHNLETVFYPVFVQDALEIISSSATSIKVTGVDAGDPAQNICIKAHALIQKDFPQVPHITIHLHKTIPVAAGLGGGSANAAFTLLLLNKKYGLQLHSDQLMRYALQLGSDCPFFIRNKPCHATGRGEQLEEIDLSLADYKIILVNPRISISTAWAFQQLQPKKPAASLRNIMQLPVSKWKGLLVNDFELPITAHYPVIRECIAALYDQGALYAALSGTGATVFGIFPKAQDVQFSFPLAYYVKEC